MMGAQELSEFGQVCQLRHTVILIVEHHRPELVDIERLTILANAFLHEKNWPLIDQFQTNIDNQEHRKEQDEPEHCPEEIEYTLEKAIH